LVVVFPDENAVALILFVLWLVAVRVVRLALVTLVWLVVPILLGVGHGHVSSVHVV